MSDSSLEKFVEEVSGNEFLRVQDDLGFGYVRLKAAEAQRRQAKQDIRCFENVVIEMLRNSRDAHAHMIFLASWTEGRRRFLTMLDDGDGIPESMHETVFEPFVTSKLDSFRSDRWGVHGRGMALYSIRQNVEQVKVQASEPGLGSVFSVINDSSELPEKRDQSTLPSITLNEEGKTLLRGPHNIVRTALEFAIDERDSIVVFYGSAAEIVSTLYWMGKGALDKLKGDYATEEGEPYVHRFARCVDASELADLSQSLGLPLSTRTAYRIMANQVNPLETVLESVLGDAPANRQQQNGKKPASKRAAVRIAAEDLEPLKQSVAGSFAAIAESYYLDANPDIDVSVKGSNLVVRIPLERI